MWTVNHCIIEAGQVGKERLVSHIIMCLSVPFAVNVNMLFAVKHLGDNSSITRVFPV